MRRRLSTMFGLTAATTAAVVAVAVAIAQAAGGGSAPVSVSGATGENEYPALAVDANGDATVAWGVSAQTGGLETMTIEASDRSGPDGTWSPPQQLSDVNEGSGTPTVALAPSGAGVIAWTETIQLPGQRSFITVVDAVTRSGPSQPWSAPVRISRTAASSVSVGIGAAGTVTAVWSEDYSVNPAIASATANTATGKWSSIRLLARKGRGGLNPQLTISAAGAALVGWQRQLSRTPQRHTLPIVHWAQMATLRAPDGTWRAPQQIATLSLPEENPGAEVWAPPTATQTLDGAGNPTVTWSADSSSKSDSHELLEVAHGDAASGRWTAPTALATDPGPTVIGTDSAGRTLVLWTSSFGRMYFRTSSNGAAWSQTETLARHTGAFLTSLTVAPDGRAILTWLGAHDHVLVRTRASATGRWSAPATTGSGGFPQAAFDAAGQATIVWPKLLPAPHYGSQIYSTVVPQAQTASAAAVQTTPPAAPEAARRATVTRDATAASVGTATANRRVAIATANHDLTTPTLPPGATRTSTDASAHHLLGQISSRPLLSDYVDVHRFYRLPGSESTVAAYFRAHPPARTTLTGTGSARNLRTGVGSESLSFSYAKAPAGVFEAGITVNLAIASAGGTAVRIDSWAAWLVPRPSWESVPATAQTVTVTANTSDGTHAYPIATVTDPATVKRLIALVDGLGIQQPGAVFGCPAIAANSPAIELSFSAAPGSPALATATQNNCGSLEFTVGSRKGPMLADSVDLTARLWSLHVLPQCSSSQLSAAAEPLTRTPAPVELTVPISLSDTASSACGLQGYPKIQLLGAGDQALPTNATRIPTGKPVTPPVTLIDPSWPGGTSISWPRPSSSCHAPQATAVALTLPGATSPANVTLGAKDTPVAPCGGRISVAPLGVGSVAPLGAGTEP
jgi:Protein of unknown function (DUF4232)